ncbi:MAG: sigma-54-dependent transcriptional regulator, partial [Chloroflexota bacterium]
MAHKILLIDDEPLNLDLLGQELSELGYSIETAGGGAEALKRLPEICPDLVLVDYQMPEMNGVEVLSAIHKSQPDLPVVIITAYGTIDRAVEAMKAGAEDFIPKPFDPEHLAVVVKKALERSRLKAEVEILAEKIGERFQLVPGKSPLMAHAIDEARKAAASKSTVLLLGESGTGKEIFARAIHTWSQRRSEPFVAINCVGLSRDLLESELFGHEKGAFTGAHQLKKGKIELANGGTVFLDEIGDISAELQTKLLRFVQEREFERLGGNQRLTVDVRIIAATNRDLEQAVAKGVFREDLYHRLNVIPIVLPPLRQRREDIPQLAAHFIRHFSAETKKKFTRIATDAQEKLAAYEWPGNVRELANVIERAVVLGEGPELTLHHLPARILDIERRPPAYEVRYHDAVNTYRHDLIMRALDRAHGNRAAAAKALGLHRTHLMKLIKALGITEAASPRS